MTDAPRNFRDDEAYARRLTNYLFRKTRHSSPSITWGDIYSDVCLAWVQCRDNYDPDKGASFKTYFSHAVMRNYGIAARRRYRSTEAHTISFDHYRGDNNDGDAQDDWDALADQAEDIERAASQRQRLRRLSGKFPLLTRMLELCADTPDDLQQEISALREYTARAGALGVAMEAAPTAMTVNNLHKIFGFNWRHRRILHEEMERAAEYVG